MEKAFTDPFKIVDTILGQTKTECRIVSCDRGIILYVPHIISVMHAHNLIFSSFCSSFPLLELDLFRETIGGRR